MQTGHCSRCAAQKGEGLVTLQVTWRSKLADRPPLTGTAAPCMHAPAAAACGGGDIAHMFRNLTALSCCIKPLPAVASNWEATQLLIKSSVNGAAGRQAGKGKCCCKAPHCQSCYGWHRAWQVHACMPGHGTHSSAYLAHN